MSAHPWVLVAPWYRWPRAGVPSSGRGTAPVFQKFSSDTFVLDFLADPQHSLQFDDEVDRVQRLEVTALPLLGNKLTSLFTPKDKNNNRRPFLTSLHPTEMRKIYLDTHSRHYLVVCELHCDVAGFPRANAQEVCQAGMVVRRRALSYPQSAQTEARSIVTDLVAVESALSALAMSAPGGDCGCGPGKHLAVRLRSLFKVSKPSLPALEEKRAQLTARLAAWRGSSGAAWMVDGWIAGDRDRIGSWQLVEDEPQDLLESWLPMWPLIADPTKPGHDATGRTIYYGVLPTASFDTDPYGKARFDSATTYEIRCFVRRHDPRCPRGDAPDCHGELVWSRPTESYRLAPHFDLQGTSNRPVTIQMPDLAELAAQARSKPPIGKFSPVKIVQQQSLAPKVKDSVCKDGDMGGPAICFISIPLITIVALFVFNIFLPIVVLVFGLWFLLAFKFCIPPKIALDVVLAAKLDALQAQLNVVAAADFGLDESFSLTAELKTGGTFAFDTASLNADLKADLSASYAQTYGFDPAQAASDLDRYSSAPLEAPARASVALRGLPTNVEDDPQVRGEIEAGVTFEPRRQPEGATP